MKFLHLIWANLMRRKARTVFTILSVLIAFVLFGVLGAVRQAFTGGVQLAGADRLVTMNRIGLIESMPINYSDRIAKIPGVAEVSWQEWVGAYYQDPRQPITAFAVDVASYLDVHQDMHMPMAQRQNWLKDRSGVMVGAAVARKYGWKVG
ncbi:MAG: ABC transporter permease, partial [Gammaproteobacteria bacterium]